MKAAVVCVIKDAEIFIEEWALYHLVVGFDSIILLDNSSTDGTRARIENLSTLYDVRLIDWPLTGFDYQFKGFEHGLWSVRSEFNWCACIDGDEFIVPPDGQTVRTMLAGVAPDVDSVALPWAIYGSSGHMKRPGDLVIKSYLRRSHHDYYGNMHVKSIVRPYKVVKCLTPHSFEVVGKYADFSGRIYDEPFSTTMPVLDFQFGKINHYYVKSVQCWAEKLGRGYHDVVRSQDDFTEADRNEVFDDAAARFAPAVSSRLATLRRRLFWARLYRKIRAWGRRPS